MSVTVQESRFLSPFKDGTDVAENWSRHDLLITLVEMEKAWSARMVLGPNVQIHQEAQCNGMGKPGKVSALTNRSPQVVMVHGLEGQTVRLRLKVLLLTLRYLLAGALPGL